MQLIRTLRTVRNHPLNRSNRMAAMMRTLRWQVGSRLLSSGTVIPFTKRTRLLVKRGMTGATGNIYCGLHDFEDMAFVLHLLRTEDTFVDIGANVGTYTVLASGQVGARSIAIEPIPQTFEHLLDNVFLNRLNDRVTLHNCGAG
ncbi:MAG: FkbM family methyltransferase, partial [Pirellulales bacterium]